ncbi:HEPN-associated N-terminal domain-containing protein [Pseudomonas sp. JV245A]|uniref:HEPN-associated N-terminal domain-containing protein n=1 Tax=Pseudomonas sp. JV245A TaxID=1890668 RepID=UPI0028E155AE|nr:HEPN-associated N-terminal domain-containing protein [Pseudomonas sp. JV245A]MDT9644007.1 RES family NAD+ phosphorylase [Pseudomonas sp. JV245A]
MGGVKRMMEEDMERGFSRMDDTYVCARCVDDDGLISFIRANSTKGTCSYCDKNRRVADMNDVIEHIVTSLSLEWGDAANEGLAYETREGGWQGSVYGTWDLLDNYGPECSEEVLSTIVGSIHDVAWCRRDPYSLPIDRTLVYGWQSFSKFITHTARFVFYKAVNTSYAADQHDEMNPVDILETLGSVTKKLDLMGTVPAGQPIFRVRIVDPETQLIRSHELGPPPVEHANMPNRMSPVGIPMFYGAFDQDTAIRETYNPAGGVLKKAAAGEFSPIRDLRIVDLSQSFFVPSLFHPKLQTLRPYFSFMRDFVEDFTKPIERSDRAHADYVPTQVVTEYFRHVYRTDDDHQIDGIIYPSSKTGDKAIVIFADATGCIDAGEEPNDRTLLRLDRAFDIDLSGFDAAHDDDEFF